MEPCSREAVVQFARAVGLPVDSAALPLYLIFILLYQRHDGSSPPPHHLYRQSRSARRPFARPASQYGLVSDPLQQIRPLQGFEFQDCQGACHSFSFVFSFVCPEITANIWNMSPSRLGQSMVAGLQNDSLHSKLKLLELERSVRHVPFITVVIRANDLTGGGGLLFPEWQPS